MKKIKVLGVTGIRSEFDILKATLSAMNASDLFDVKLVISGAHLSDWHGGADANDNFDGMEICDRIDTLFMTNRKTQRAKAVGMLTYGLSQTVERVEPDFLLCVGDREESLATGIVANYMDVLYAHLGGGDPVWGNADDPVRFAASKLAHIHFTTAKAYADNLLSLGEEDFRVFWTGNPALDGIRKTKTLSLKEVSDHLGIDITDGRYVVVIKHPLSSERDNVKFQMETALKSLDEFGRENNIKIVGIYPNTDPGSYEIIDAIAAYDNSEIVHYFKTLPQDIFVNLLRNTLALAGNSSMGILEAPFYGLPVVNIGNRQQGRLNAGNLKFIEYDIAKIKAALSEACFDEGYRTLVKGLECPYGDGHSSEKVMKILQDIHPADEKWYIKRKLC